MEEEGYYCCGSCEYDKIKYMDKACPKCGSELEWGMVEHSIPEEKIEPLSEENSERDVIEEIPDDIELRTKIYDFVYSLKKNMVPMADHARIERKVVCNSKKKIIKLYNEIKSGTHIVPNTECVYCKGKNARMVAHSPDYVVCVCTNCNPPSRFCVNYDFLDFLDTEK